MKWIYSFLVFTQLLSATDHNQLLEQASVLTPDELEIIFSNPETTYVYLPENLRNEIKAIQSFYQEEDWDDDSKALYFYVNEGYKIVPHSLLENATNVSIARQRLHAVELESTPHIPTKMHTNHHLSREENKLMRQLPNSFEPLSATQCFLTGPRGKRGHHGSEGPPGPGGTFSGVVLDNAFTIVDATDQTKKLQFDVQGSPATTTTIITNPTVNRNFITPDITGTALVAETGTNFVFIGGPTTTLFGSNSGIQYSTTVANRAQIRFNQFGNNAGIPGISTFKSRSTTIGGLAPVLPGDVIFRDTAVGVTDNLSIPLSGLISIIASGVPVGAGWIATDYEIQLVPLAGPANSRRPVFRITSEGIFHITESANSMAGIAVTAAAGTIVVNNTQVTATSRITLTIQDGGVVPTGFVYVASRVNGTSFTIQSSSNQVGVRVYYQIWEPTP